jgi:hypothetical protein
MSDKPVQKESSSFAIAGLAAAAFGFYAGMMILVPLAATFAIGWLYGKYAAAEKQIWKVAIAVQGGHVIWFIVGLVSIGVLDAHALDPIVLIAGICWIYFRPGIAPVASLCVIQLLATAYNICLVIGTEFGSSANKVLLVHIAFRLVAVGAMGYALYMHKKAASNKAPLPNHSLKADGPDGPRL